ncbi:MAG: CmpX [uncultured Nocardioidaceae bacterium]|uniref:CmpX n=1 Tax=uncultured Nocardioidaceae bacterium TaxID=253824 RepID=A0A6J4N2G7_9ACTN|nr:MAG: CmpX [uncultured Nocardioidaceae bacterium]
MEDALTSALTTIATFVPKLVMFLVILLVGWLIAKALAKVANAVLERIGFDRAVERGGVKKALERSKYDASDIVGKLIYYVFFLFVLQLAFGVFGANPISALLQQVIGFLPSVIVAIVIIVVAAAIAKAIHDLVATTLGGLSYGKLLANIASAFILGLGIIAALNQVGVATTVTTPVLVAVLGTIAGILIVGVGGGMIRPMQARWDRWLSSAEQESGAFREQVRNAPSAREQASQAAQQASASSSGGDYAQTGQGSTATAQSPYGTGTTY